MKTITQFLAAWLVGTVIAYAMGSVAQSIFVLRELAAAGAALTAGVWFQVIVHDLGSLAFGGKYIWYGGNLAVAFLVAFPCAILVGRLLKLPLSLVATVAGAVALVTMIEIINYNAPNTLFAGTRGLAGMIAQVIAGGIGGLLFAVSWQRLNQAAAGAPAP